MRRLPAVRTRNAHRVRKVNRRPFDIGGGERRVQYLVRWFVPRNMARARTLDDRREPQKRPHVMFIATNLLRHRPYDSYVGSGSCSMRGDPSRTIRQRSRQERHTAAVRRRTANCLPGSGREGAGEEDEYFDAKTRCAGAHVVGRR